MRGRDLYIIQSRVTGAIKIGRSKDVHARLKQLQTGSPHKLKILIHVPNKGHLETRLHRHLQCHRLKRTGEWYSVDCLPDLPVWLYEMLDLENADWWIDE